MKFASLVPVVTVVATACLNGATDPMPAVPDASGRIAFTIDDVALAGQRLPRDAFDLVSARMVGDTVVMDIQYGGGCAEHAFVLVGSSAFAESDPVQTMMRLAHDGRGDVCRALIGNSLRADLSPLRDWYRRSYQTEHGRIAIHFAGTTLLYTF